MLVGQVVPKVAIQLGSRHIFSVAMRFCLLASESFTSIEVKTPKGRPSAKQLNWQHQVNTAGGIARIIRSADEL